MIKHIVYKSDTGFSQAYARLLSEKLRIPYADMDEKSISELYGEQILFVSGLNNYKINDLRKARKKFSVEAIVAVGISRNGDILKKRIIERNHLTDLPLFYLRGDASPENVSGFDKVKLKVMADLYKLYSSGKKKDKLPAVRLPDQIFTGIDYVYADNLAPVIDWYSSYLIIKDIFKRKYKGG